jgi:hypothetical protein
LGIFGVASFLVGILGLAVLAVRRSKNIPADWPDYVMIFVGIAGSIMGLAVVFLRFS